MSQQNGAWYTIKQRAVHTKANILGALLVLLPTQTARCVAVVRSRERHLKTIERNAQTLAHPRCPLPFCLHFRSIAVGIRQHQAAHVGPTALNVRRTTAMPDRSQYQQQQRGAVDPTRVRKHDAHPCTCKHVCSQRVGHLQTQRMIGEFSQNGVVGPPTRTFMDTLVTTPRRRKTRRIRWQRGRSRLLRPQLWRAAFHGFLDECQRIETPQRKSVRFAEDACHLQWPPGLKLCQQLLGQPHIFKFASVAKTQSEEAHLRHARASLF
mmetsp:Transcript_43841/g.115813  ORF Transcript_43841/g.115813 Transcript_43841/m.115813 type:complete len:266 (+) Transcript_43841:727-1524(+)